MSPRVRSRPGAIPRLLLSTGTDEYRPPPPGVEEQRALALAADETRRLRRGASSPPGWSTSRCATATALRALNEAWGERFYDVPPEAETDAAAADEAFAATGPVIDVQTHYVARERPDSAGARAVMEFIRSVAPDRWRGLRGALDLGFADYLRCVFLESETSLAVLTAAPGEGQRNILTNAEIAGTRELLDRLGDSGRLLHHAIVHPNVAGELAAMESLRDRFHPVGWKVYTVFGEPGAGWRLDDPATGTRFLARARELEVPLVCAHKGLAALARGSSPEDVGPAAAAFPEIDFLIYHAGFEVEVEEGPYLSSAPNRGADRLLASLAGAGIAPGSNVWAELGSTWFALVRRPREAAHLLGKLLLALGEDRVLWGTDSVWYGSPQPLIDAFRAFRIPDRYREAHGYPGLDAGLRAKVLARNAAAVYRVDLPRLIARTRDDDLAWVRAALEEESRRGTPRLGV